MWIWHGRVCSSWGWFPRLFAKKMCATSLALNTCWTQCTQLLHYGIGLVLVSNSKWQRTMKLLPQPEWNLQSACRWGAESCDLGMWSHVVIADFDVLVARGQGRSQHDYFNTTQRDDDGEMFFVLAFRRFVMQVMIHMCSVQMCLNRLWTHWHRFAHHFLPPSSAHFWGVTASFSEFPWNEVGPLCSTIVFFHKFVVSKSYQWSPFILCRHEEYILAILSSGVHDTRICRYSLAKWS